MRPEAGSSLSGASDGYKWSHSEHGADIGLRAEARTREGLFEAMGAALTGVITLPALVRPDIEVIIECEAPDDALLLIDWLNALIFEMATRNMLFGAWHVHLDGCRLEGRVRGEAVDITRHEPAVEVKGATYTALEVSQASDGRWLAQCVVDV